MSHLQSVCCNCGAAFHLARQIWWATKLKQRNVQLEKWFDQFWRNKKTTGKGVCFSKLMRMIKERAKHFLPKNSLKIWISTRRSSDDSTFAWYLACKALEAFVFQCVFAAINRKSNIDLADGRVNGRNVAEHDCLLVSCKDFYDSLLIKMMHFWLPKSRPWSSPFLPDVVWTPRCDMNWSVNSVGAPRENCCESPCRAISVAITWLAVEPEYSGRNDVVALVSRSPLKGDVDGRKL